MSITRLLFNDFRPLFSVFDDPFFVGPSNMLTALAQPSSLVSQEFVRTPQVHLKEESNRFIVQAELPGVPKDNIDVTVGDNGRSLTIKGSTFSKRQTPGASVTEVPADQQASRDASPESDGHIQPTGEASSSTLTKSDEERKTRLGSYSSFRSSFARTIWLPQPVDIANVTAKLEHGILTLRLPKAQNSASSRRIAINGEGSKL